MKHLINWRSFFILLALSLISVICVLPYVMTVQAEALAKLNAPILTLIVAQVLQSTILFSIAIFFGLLFAKKTGFTLPVIEAPDAKTGRKIFKSFALKSVLVGVAAAVAIYALDAAFTAGGAGITTHKAIAPVWQTLLAAAYGGTTEEILTRLFLVTFFAWLGMKIFRRAAPTRPMIMIAIVLAAVLFGLGHLPITAAITNIDALTVLRAVALNGIAGLAFGWLFWKKGLESAMLAHFTADVILLTVLPAVFR